MVLEAIVVCIDNSSWMRNGDYVPTRLDAQNEAVNYVSSIKTQSNPETTVGILAMAGKRIDVLLTLSRDLGHIMNALHAVKPEGECNFISGLKTAQLVLKNRQNKNQKQRVIMFCGSPVNHEKKALEKVAKNMKKNNVAVDVINFGEENGANGNTEKLEAFIAAVNSGDNSRLVNIPPGPHNLSDMIVSTIMSESGGGSVPGGGGGAGDFGLVDPSVDPELALALRMSMEEERARQEQQVKADESAQDGAKDVEMADATADKDQEMVAEEADDEDEEALLAEAIAMSLLEAEEDEDALADDDIEMEDASESPPADKEEPKEEEPKVEEPVEEPKEENEVEEALQDPEFLGSLLDSLAGIENEEITVEDLLDSVKEKDEEGDKPEDKKS